MRLLLALVGVSAMIGLAAPAYGDAPPAPLGGDDAGFLAALRCTKPASATRAQIEPSRPAKRCARA